MWRVGVYVAFINEHPAYLHACQEPRTAIDVVVVVGGDGGVVLVAVDMMLLAPIHTHTKAKNPMHTRPRPATHSHNIMDNMDMFGGAECASVCLTFVYYL